MKLKLWLFTLLVGLFSTAGFCKVPFTDLAENSKKESVTETFPEMVKLDLEFSISDELKALVDIEGYEPVIMQEVNISFISKSLSSKIISYGPDVIVCIRDKLRLV